MIKLGNLNIAEIYLGDYKVSKMYAGDEVIYDQSSPTPGGTSIYDSNGNLIIPAGTVCQIRDYSGGGDPVTTEYVLPSDIVISGTDGEVTLSDGQRVRYYTSVSEEKTTNTGTLTVYLPNISWRDTITRTLELTTQTSIYTGQYWRGFRYISGGSTDNLRVGLPYGVFKVGNIPEGYTEAYIYFYSLYKESFFKLDNVYGYYLHEIPNSSEILWSRLGYDVGGRGKISEDDIELEATGSATSYLNFQQPGYSYEFPIKPNTRYCMYALMKEGVALPREGNTDEYILPSNTGRMYIRYKNTTYYYDEPLSVTVSGYNFGDGQDIHVSITHYDYPNKLGTTKINEELKYYDTVPVNEE